MKTPKGIKLTGDGVRHERAHQADKPGLSHTDISMLRASPSRSHDSGTARWPTIDVQDAVRPQYSQPPMRTLHTGSDATKSERIVRPDPSSLSSLEGPRGTMGRLDENRNEPTKDSPVSTKGRQLPDRNDTAKAAAVARTLAKQPAGESFPRGGSMDER